MKRCVSILNALFLSASSLGLFMTADSALATPVIEDNLSTCTATNCESVTVYGSYRAPSVSTVSKPTPAVYQVYASANECLRIEGFVPSGITALDIEATLISPTGRVWQNDDGAANNQPLIKAQTNNNGWYTLQIAHWSGSTSQGNFALRIGRYSPNNNANCSSATQPVTGTAVQETQKR